MKHLRKLAWPWTKSEWTTKKRAWVAIPIYLLIFIVVVGSSTEDPAATKADSTKAVVAKKAAPKKKTLAQSLKASAREEVGKERVKSVSCKRDGKDTLCEVQYRMGSMWDADNNEVARDVGGMVDRLFKDTDVQYLHVIALTDTTDNLGNETKDDDVAWVVVRRSGWKKVNWKNLQYSEPAAGIRAVSEVYADTLR